MYNVYCTYNVCIEYGSNMCVNLIILVTNPIETIVRATANGHN